MRNFLSGDHISNTFELFYLFIDCVYIGTQLSQCMCGSHSNSGYLVSPSTFTWVLRINLKWSVLHLGMQVLFPTQSLFRLPLSFFLRQLLMHPRLSTSLQWGHWWLWTPDSPFFTYQVLGMQACTTMVTQFLGYRVPFHLLSPQTLQCP